MSESSDNTNSLSSMFMKGAVGYARFRAVGSVIVTFLIFCILSSIGYYIYNIEDAYGNNFTKGKVNQGTCTKYDKNAFWDCSMNLSYNIDNNKYDKDYKTTSFTYYGPGSLIDLRYNKHDKTDITTDTFNNRLKGSIFIFVGFILLMFSLGYLYSVFAWDIVAVSDSAGNIAGNIASSISRGINSGINNRRV
jgi:hypothetical protein